MKRNWLAGVLAGCLVLTGVYGINCQCLISDCSSAVTALDVLDKKPHCHHEAATTPRAPKECCGKCQIEKNAVLFRDFLASIQNIFQPGLSAKDKAFVKFSEPLKKAVLFLARLRSPPQPFFTQHILTVTFGFRSPPLFL